MDSPPDNNKRLREEQSSSSSPSPDIDLPEFKRLRDELVRLLEDSDSTPPDFDIEPFVGVLSEEIPTVTPPPSDLSPEDDSVNQPPELGFLLEASDDELGLPPATAADGEATAFFDGEKAEVYGDGGCEEFWRFGDEFGCFDGDTAVYGGVDGGEDYLTVDGLFDDVDVGWEPLRMPNVSSQPLGVGMAD